MPTAQPAAASQAEGNDLITCVAWHQLAEVETLHGHLRAAEEAYLRSQELARRAGDTRAGFADAALVGLGTIAYERGEYDQSAYLITTGLRHGSIFGDLATMDGQSRLADIALLRGDTAAALEHIHAATTAARRLKGDVFSMMVAAQRARMAMHMEDRAQALAWLDEITRQPPSSLLLREVTDLSRGAILYMLGRLDEALAIAGAVVQAATAGQRLRHVVEALVLRANILQGLGRTEAAQIALQEAHAVADPHGMVAVFHEGSRISSTLPSEPTTTDTLLTSREVEVVQLIAAGLSNSDIADHLVVAPSTVKKHINRIFAKLDVTSRTQALVRARALGLLS